LGIFLFDKDSKEEKEERKGSGFERDAEEERLRGKGKKVRKRSFGGERKKRHRPKRQYSSAALRASGKLPALG